MLGLREVFRQLLRDVRHQKLRTFLTVFGIVWGTVAVSLLLAFGRGLQIQLIKNTAGLGDRIVIAWPGLTSKPFEGLGRGRRISVGDDDIDYVRSQAAAQGVPLKGIAGEYQQNLKVTYQTRNLGVDVSGVPPQFGLMRNLIPAPGSRFLDELDVASSRRVAFVGNKLAEDLFGKGVDAVGKVFLIAGSPVTAIGVLKEKPQDSNYNGPDSGMVFIPATTFKALTGRKHVSNLIYQAETAGQTKTVSDAVRRLFSERLRFDPEDKEAFGLWDTTEEFTFLDTFMTGFRLFLGIVGSLTLVVGGIGVSNIMNVAVEERTHEIGIKMALGARERSIMTQFLLETLLVTALGGGIGFAIALSVCAIFPKFQLAEYVGDPVISWSVGGLTAAILGLVGLLAGYFPARDASRLDPVVAMKL